MKKYNVGVLGCGAVWNYHKLAFSNSDRLNCSVVFDPSADRAKEAADEFGCRIAASADDLLVSDDVDIVAMLTPVFTHAELVEKGAAAGKHFMLEKPLANSMQDADRIVKAIDDAGVKCFHPTLRALFSDLYDEIEKWTRPDGEVGPVRCVFYQMIAWPYAPSAWLLDRGICFPPSEYSPHVFDTFLALTNATPKSVSAHTGNYARPFNQDDVNSLHIDFDDNRHMQFDIHWVVDPKWNAPARISYELICERGLIRHNWVNAEWFTSEGSGRFESKRTSTGGQRWDHYHALIDAIENNTEVHPDHHDGLKYVRIQDAAIQSAKSKQTVTL